MTGTVDRIRFEARLLRPAGPKGATWTFLVLPAGASEQLPTRGMVGVEGLFQGRAFKTKLSPDGQGSHWLKIPRALREAARVEVGDTVAIELSPAAGAPATRVPADLRKALAAHPAAKAQWKDLGAVARRDWIQWIVNAKKAETRERRVHSSCDMLAGGKRRVCCFDRSGIFSKALAAPKAAV
jgi:hypothetical protein